MNGLVDENDKEQQIYAEFLHLFQEIQPDRILVLIGDRDNYGHLFAQRLIKESGTLGKICILKGGIDAICLEYP